MSATVTQLPVRKPQAPPPPGSEEASFLSLVYEMGRAEGRREAYAAMRVPQPPRSRPAVLAFTGPAS